ncbi:MAG: 30S ribosomal protein S12 methylthiotransferase RimO [Eubacteriaceae bacterium]
MTYNIGLVSLGCAKNLVDSEVMLGLIEKSQFNIVEELNLAHIIIVNTCGFIDSAKEESIDTILKLARYKEIGDLKVLIASGCLSERYREELLKEIPELDGIIGTGDYKNIINVIEETLNGKKICSYGHINDIYDETLPRKISTPNYTAFIKIGDGCNNNCTYCIIPTLRGRFRSRKIENIISEIENLVSNGVKELIVIAQDITQYGIDIYGEFSLTKLLKEIDKIENLKWLRLLYTYPENIDEELIAVIKQSDKILNYLDIPFQHTQDKILKSMGRKTTNKKIIDLISKLRSEIPDIIIRSSIITGFPGESEEDFNDMLKTLSLVKIDRLGVFTYSQEEGTKSALFENQLSQEIKENRRDIILKMQQEISLSKNKSMINKKLKILIEGKTDNENVYYGRSYMDAPEIDGLVYVHTDFHLKDGDFCDVLITDALEYDLIGDRIDEFTK